MTSQGSSLSADSIIMSLLQKRHHEIFSWNRNLLWKNWLTAFGIRKRFNNQKLGHHFRVTKKRWRHSQTNSATTLDLFLPTSGDRQAILPGHGGATRRPKLAIRDDDNDDDTTYTLYRALNCIQRHLQRHHQRFPCDSRAFLYTFV